MITKIVSHSESESGVGWGLVQILLRTLRCVTYGIELLSIDLAAIKEQCSDGIPSSSCLTGSWSHKQEILCRNYTDSWKRETSIQNLKFSFPFFIGLYY